MFRFLQDLQPQKLLLEKFLYSVQWVGRPIASERIRVGATSSTIVSSTKDFQGENVVITGGAGGLGRALAIKMARLNATVAIWDSNKEALDETANLVKVVGGRVFSYVCDMARRDEIYRVAENTKREIGQITMVINNAEVSSEKLLLDTPDYLIEKAFDVNILSHFWTTKAFLTNMIDANKGHIVTISSMAGHLGIQKLTDYCATKAAATSFLTALRTELEREGSSGVKTTIICPYFMKSGGDENAAELRIVSALNTDKVAERTIEAIKNQEFLVFMPGWFRLAILPKWITPSWMSSLLLRVLIKDPSPSSSRSRGDPMKIVQFVRATGPTPIKEMSKTQEQNEKKNKRKL